MGCARRAALLALVAGCGGPPPEKPLKVCQDTQAALCRRAYECYDATQRSYASFTGTYGTSEADCAAINDARACPTATPDDPCPVTSQRYDLASGEACRADVRAASCDQIRTQVYLSPHCIHVCE
jgi:hypothetical protein